VRKSVKLENQTNCRCGSLELGPQNLAPNAYTKALRPTLRAKIPYDSLG
jgi:hypothetical protein